jgi:hypothetical protein
MTFLLALLISFSCAIVLLGIFEKRITNFGSDDEFLIEMEAANIRYLEIGREITHLLEQIENIPNTSRRQIKKVNWKREGF